MNTLSSIVCYFLFAVTLFLSYGCRKDRCSNSDSSFRTDFPVTLPIQPSFTDFGTPVPIPESLAGLLYTNISTENYQDLSCFHPSDSNLKWSISMEVSGPCQTGGFYSEEFIRPSTVFYSCGVSLQGADRRMVALRAIDDQQLILCADPVIKTTTGGSSYGVSVYMLSKTFTDPDGRSFKVRFRANDEFPIIRQDIFGNQCNYTDALVMFSDWSAVPVY